MTEPLKEEARRAAEGRAWHSPFTTLGGVTLAVAALVAIPLTIAVVVWLVL